MPAIPTKLKVLIDGKARPWILWEGSSNCAYRIERRVESESSSWKTLGIMLATSYSDQNATIGAVNTYRVSSVNKEGESEPCPEVSILVTLPYQEKTTTSAGPVRIIKPRQRVVDVD